MWTFIAIAIGVVVWRVVVTDAAAESAVVLALRAEGLHTAADTLTDDPATLDAAVLIACDVTGQIPTGASAEQIESVHETAFADLGTVARNRFGIRTADELGIFAQRVSVAEGCG